MPIFTVGYGGTILAAVNALNRAEAVTKLARKLMVAQIDRSTYNAEDRAAIDSSVDYLEAI